MAAIVPNAAVIDHSFASGFCTLASIAFGHDGDPHVSKSTVYGRHIIRVQDHMYRDHHFYYWSKPDDFLLDCLVGDQLIQQFRGKSNMPRVTF